MRLLIVEDEVKIAQALKEALEILSYAVDVVHDGQEGLAFAIDEPYDLIILDYLLPGMNGGEICQRLRENGMTIPVLMLTARGEVEDRIAGLDAGADDYIIKPFALGEVLARVRTLLRRPSQLTPDKLTAGDLILDTHALAVERAGVAVILTLKEFAVLEYLLRHKGRTVTKETIIEHVWDYNADILPNTVEATISRLRFKIDRAFPGRVPLITTVHGFGYKVKP